jgi:histidine kinase
MSKKPRSIRNLVVALFALSTIAAFALFAAYDAIVSSYNRGETNPIVRILQPAPSAGRSMRSLSLITRRLNAGLLEGPETLTNPTFLADLSAQAFPFRIALRKGNEIAYRSAGLEKTDLAALPAFGAPAEDKPFPEAEAETRVLFQFDFYSRSGGRDSLFILSAARRRGFYAPFGKQILLFAALLLLAADAAAGVFAIMRLTLPLRRVEKAALAMSSGDLDTPVEGDQILELSRVFDALDTMRSEIRELLQRGRDREAERRELIANLSHDLRTPLAAIRGYVDGLREGIADTPEKRERYLRVAGQKILDLDRMIDRIFLLSTLEANACPPEPRRIDLRAFLRDSIDELSLSHCGEDARFSASGIEAAPGNGPLFVSVDPLQLRRVVENLVENSLKHSGKRPVSVSVSLALSESKGGSPRRALLSVEDDGRGIAEAQLGRIFDRFYRGESSRPGGGVGLGLAIARQIIEAHGGTIRAGRDGLGGAAFVIELPLDEAKP